MKDKWIGWLIDKSLRDISILSKLRVINSKVEENTEGDKKEVWNVYTVEVDDKEIDKISKVLENLTILGYYAHFTNRKSLIIIFSRKSFKMNLEKVGKDKPYEINYFKLKPEDKKIWQSAFKYGTTKGKVDSRYLLEIE